MAKSAVCVAQLRWMTGMLEDASRAASISHADSGIRKGPSASPLRRR